MPYTNKNMKPLIRKELISIVCSGTGLIFAFVFLLACGAMLWFFEGNFNIPDAGYATLEKFIALSPILLIILIPALTMRSVAEEKKNGTFGLLLSRPLSMPAIWFSKWLAIFLFVGLVIISTVTYVYTLYILGSPIGNIDLQATIISYICLILLAGIFIAIGLFTSSLTSNQIVAFVSSLLLNFFVFYGFDLLSNLSSSGSLQTWIASCGLSHHFVQMQRGVVESSDIAVFIFYFVVAWVLSLFVLVKKLSKRELIFAFVGFLFVVIFAVFLNFRLDFTNDKRYTLSEYTKDLMMEVKESNVQKIKIDVFLEGNLNAGFQQLRNSTADLLSDLNIYAGHKFDVVFTDPSSLSLSRELLPEYMAKEGMPGILLNEVDRNGKVSQQLIYPYARIILGNDTLPVALLKNVAGKTAEENLNSSSENLEFQFVDALQLIMHNEEQDIAFIEGHGEVPRAYIYDAEEALAKYYYINRGQIENDLSVLDGFKAVIIAGPTQKFSETEKYIIDQYLMKGGRILWLLDGVYVSQEDLSEKGFSASIKNETNLDDLLFAYGVRIQPVLVQDSQCASILVNTGKDIQPVAIPWYYSPLLLPSPDNTITKGIAEVKSEFASSIDLLESSRNLDRQILLTTAAHSRIVRVPETIDFDVLKLQSDPDYFDTSFQTVAVSLDGVFSSAFTNRLIPDSVNTHGNETLKESKPARMVVIASSRIIRNDIIGQGENTQVLPMGFDRLSERLYGNRDFILNAVNWLVNDNIIQIKSKSRQLNLLNKQAIYDNRNKYALVNTLLPILFIGVIILFVTLWRKRKYSK